MFKQHTRKATLLAVGTGASLCAAIAYASTANITNTFSPGTAISSADVNQNFVDLKTAIDDNDARIASLEAGSGPAPVLIDCNTASATAIQDALDSAVPEGSLTITLDGSCTENVVIRRDNVTLAGGTGGGIIAASNAAPAIAVENAAQVQISDLTVSGGLNAISVTLNSTAAIAGNTVSGAVQDPSSPVPSGAALFVDAGSAVELQGNNSLTGSAADGSGAVFAFRSSHIKLAGNNNSIIAGTPQGFDETFALGVSHGSSLIQEDAGTGNALNGGIESSSNSQVFVRAATINGPIFSELNSSVSLFPASSSAMIVTSDEIEVGMSSTLDLADDGVPVVINAGGVSGTLRLLDQSSLLMASGSTINMNVEMFRSCSIDASENATIGGSLDLNNFSTAVFNDISGNAVGGTVTCGNVEAFSFDTLQNFTDLCNSI